MKRKLPRTIRTWQRKGRDERADQEPRIPSDVQGSYRHAAGGGGQPARAGRGRPVDRKVGKQPFPHLFHIHSMPVKKTKIPRKGYSFRARIML